MPDFSRDELRAIKSFPQLVKYLRDELDWPIEADDFEEITFDYDPEELGIDPETAAKIQEIKQLRPLVSNQPWGIFFLRFEPKKLPVVVLRRILSKLVIKKRASAKTSERAVWNLHDLLFISNYGEGEQRQITFANFSQDETLADLPTLKVLGWDYEDTELHIDDVHNELKAKLRWPDDDKDTKKWRETWSSAFILRNREVITTSKGLAIMLAAVAQRIRHRAKRVLELENVKGPMRQLYRAFQETLIHDLKEDDFADMYAQTIAYGLLAARMSRPMGITSSNITDMVPNTNPFLRDILGTFIATGGRQGKIDFDELGVQEIVELLNSPDTHMEAVLRDFGNRTRQEDPVIHFYELFLTEYDKKKKVQRGVFYTPQPVVSYIVRSVQELLQKGFGLEDGLADVTTWGQMIKRNNDIKIPEGVSPNEPFVQILDPAVGTATFLVEVIDVIHKTMMAKWLKQGHMALEFPQLWNEYVPKNLLPRLYGYELMMAPYAIAHMRLGLKLFETGYRFGAENARANVYLTNSLEPAGEVGPHRKFEQLAPALAHEAKAVNAIKWNKHFTVIIGNPPYSGVSANTGDWISRLVQDYYQVDGSGLGERNPKWLQDDYVKFLRAGQFLCEQNPMAIFGFITNHGYIDNPTFRGMRQSLLTSFRELWVLDLHGNIKKRETTSNGSLDENVFDIQQGVAVFLAARGTKNALGLKQSDVFGNRVDKYALLTTNTVNTLTWRAVSPVSPFYVFLPQDEDVRAEYLCYSSIKKIMPVNVLGFQTHRDHFAVAIDRETIVTRCEALRNTHLTDGEIKTQYELSDNTGWNVRDARKSIREDYKWESHVVPCLYRPFDTRWCYFSTVAMDRPRRELLDHVAEKENLCLLVPRQVSFLPWQHTGVSRIVAESCLVSNKTKEGNYNFPLYLYPPDDFLTSSTSKKVNFSGQFLNELSSAIGQKLDEINGLPDGLSPEQIFHYVYGLLYSPTYRSRYAEFLKTDFPRLPLASSLELFRALSLLGGELVACT